MNATQPANYLLLVPANGKGDSHLRAEAARGPLCGANTGRKLFQIAGYVPTGGSCADCLTAAARAASA